MFLCQLNENNYMNDITKKRLVEAGWSENRQIDTTIFKDKYDEIGLNYPESIDDFLKKYGMLKINPKDKKYFDVSFDAIAAIGCNLDGDYFRECLDEYDIEDRVYPVGEACRSELFVLMTSNGKFYCYTDGLLVLLGNSVDEMLDCVVGECRKAVRID